MLKQISEGKEDEIMGDSGYGIGLTKKKSQRENDHGTSWGEGMLNSMSRGFLNR